MNSISITNNNAPGYAKASVTVTTPEHGEQNTHLGAGETRVFQVLDNGKVTAEFIPVEHSEVPTTPGQPAPAATGSEGDPSDNSADGPKSEASPQGETPQGEPAPAGAESSGSSDGATNPPAGGEAAGAPATPPAS